MSNPARRRITRSAIGAAAAFIWLTPRAPAQTGSALLVEPFPKEQLIDTRAGWTYQDAGHVKETREGVRLSIYESTGRVRLFPGSLTSPRVGWQLQYIDVDLGPGSDLLPGQLGDQSVGAAFPIAKIGDWVLAAGLGLGYAGASPFGEGNGWYGKATAVALRQFSEKDALIVILDYDGNRTLLPDLPLPGVAYTRRVSPSLFYVVGVPVTSVTWKPIDKLSLEAGWHPIEAFHAAVGYEFAPHWSAFGSFDYHSSAFFLRELNENDRLLFQERHAEVGVKWSPREEFGFTAALGYTWGREFSTGFDARDTDEVADLSDEPYFRVGLEVKF
jgi:hypothetical protein